LQLFIDAIESRENLAVFVEDSEENLRFPVPKEITPENSDSLLACLALLDHNPNGWGVVKNS